MPKRYGVLTLLVGLSMISACIYSQLHAGYLGNRERDITLLLGIPLLVLGSCSSYTVFSHWIFRPLSFLGTISYSIYMLHMLIFRADLPFSWNGFQLAAVIDYPPAVSTPYPTWVFCFMIIPAIIFWSALSYAFIERPFLKMRPKTTPQ